MRKIPPHRQARGRREQVSTIASAHALLVLCLLATSPALARPRPSDSPGAPPGTFRLSIAGTNDLHGRLHALPLYGGYLANLRRARASDGAVLVVDAGDMFQGTLASNLAEGAPVVAAYDALGVTAVAIGNHEFDYGPVGPATRPRGPGDDPRGALRARAAQARFPFLAANVLDEATGAPLAGANIHPSALVELPLGAPASAQRREGQARIKVGLIGVTTMATAGSTLAANFAGLRLAPLAPTIAGEARALRTRGAQVVVVLAHAGGACRLASAAHDPRELSSCAPDSEIFKVARALPAGLVDAIVAGHTHEAIAHEVAGIPIIESWANGRGFGRIDLELRPDGGAGPLRVRGRHVFPPQPLCPDGGSPADCAPRDYEGLPVLRDATVAAAVAPALARAEALQARALGVQVETTVARSYGAESALGNLITELMLKARPQADVALWNGGGLRSDLKRGPLTYGALYEAIPFDNTFALLRVRAGSLAQALARNLRGTGGFLSVAGLRVEATCAEGGLTVALARPDGTPLARDAALRVVTSDFLATGGDGLGALAERPEDLVIENEPVVRDVLAELLAARGGELRGRDWLDRKALRVRYPGRRPVRCPR